MVKLGERVMRLPSFNVIDEDATGRKRPVKKPLWGRVVYIHPKKRFHVVEFDVYGNYVRETYPGI